MAEVKRPALHDQNAVVAFYGEDGSYFIGRQTPELAKETAAYLGKSAHKLLEVIDCSDDPALAEIITDDLRSTYAENYQTQQPYRI